MNQYINGKRFMDIAVHGGDIVGIAGAERVGSVT